MQESDKLWRKDAVVCRVCPPSFAGSDGDGIGGLAGLAGRRAAVALIAADSLP